MSARGAGLARGSHRLCEPAHLCLDGVGEHAGDVVPPRVSVDRWWLASLLEKMWDCTREKLLYLDGRRSCGSRSLLVSDKRAETMPLGFCPVPHPFFRYMYL